MRRSLPHKVRSFFILASALALVALAAVGLDAGPAVARFVAPEAQRTTSTAISVPPVGAGDGLVTTMSVSPNTMPALDPTPTTFTYDINVVNSTGTAIPLNEVFNGLPREFTYVAGSSRLGAYSIADPIVDTLLFDEGRPAIGISRTMLSWDLSGIGLSVEPSRDVALTFDAQATNLPDGNYCGQAWTAPSGSTSNSYQTAKVTAGSPLATDCAGKDVQIRTSAIAGLNPNEIPISPHDDILVTYTIEVENTGTTDLNLWWLRNKLPPGFSYQYNSASGNLTSTNPDLTAIGRSRMVASWFFLPISASFSPGTTKSLSFEAVGPNRPETYLDETWTFFDEFSDYDAPYSWPSAPVTIEFPLVKDMAIGTMVPSSSNIVKGDSVTVNVTLDNLGNFIPAVFYVTLIDQTDGSWIGIQKVQNPCSCGETLTFTWDTSSASLGSHNLAASHDYADDDATNDQSLLSVTVNSLPVVDAAITSFNVSPSTMIEGDIATLDVTVGNVGNQDTGPFDVTITDTTAGVTFITQNVASLAAGASLPLSFTWNSSGATIGTHNFTATHTWADGNTANDSLGAQIDVQSPNIPPIADAGPDQILYDVDGSGAEVVTLDGSASTDADGTVVSYVWTEGVTVHGVTSSITPSLSVGVHTITLKVTDDGFYNAIDTVDVTVVANQPPIADAGPDQILYDIDGSGAEVATLDGSASTDADGTVVSYVWTEGVTVHGVTSSVTPSLSVGVHTITLKVTDNGFYNAIDTVVVTVVANQPPVANAGADFTVVDADGNGSESVVLDGTASTDADGSIASYSWAEGTTPLGSGSTLPHTLAVGVHDITLTVTDNGGAPASHTVQVTVAGVPPPITITTQPSPGAVNFNGREYLTANQEIYGNQSATPVIIGLPVFTAVTGVHNSESNSSWTFTDGGVFVDDGNHWIVSSNGNNWTLQLTGDGTPRTATFYMGVYHNGGSMNYLVTAGANSTVLSKSSRGLTHYQMVVSFTQDTTVTFEAQGSLSWSAFSLGAVVID